jgi:RHS repeat-associated protein
VSYTYDPYYSRVATMVDGIGTTSYAYVPAGTNGAGQVASVDGPLTNDTIAYTYDALGRVVQRTINGSANQVDWTFDALGRVTSEENLLGEFIYTYEGVTNRLATVTYPNDQTSTYAYMDAENDHRLQTIHHQYPNATTLSKFDYTYDAVGNILTWRQQADSTAVLWKYGYDQADQLTSAVKHATDTPQTVLQRFVYAYDPAGNRTVEQIDDAITLSAYDHLNRLTSQVPGGPMTIAGLLDEPGTVTISGVPAVVDASNNFRGTVPTTGGTNTFTVVAKDVNGNTTTQQYEVDVAGTSKAFTYDANGNVASDGARVLAWDSRDQLVSIASGDQALSLTYGALGNLATTSLVQNSVQQTHDVYLWCGSLRCEARDASSAIRRSFALGSTAGSNHQLETFDHLGSLRAVTDSSAAPVASLDYDPLGRPSSLFEAISLKGFAGLSALAMSTWAANFRTFDVGSARWLSRDPLSLEGGVNLYAYASNNPIALVDPPGLKPFPGFNYCGPGNNLGRPTNDLDRACQRHDTCYGNAGVEGLAGLMGGGGTSKACELDQCDINLCAETIEALPRLRNPWNKLIAGGVMDVFCFRYRRPPTPTRPPFSPCVTTSNGRVFCYNPL